MTGTWGQDEGTKTPNVRESSDQREDQSSRDQKIRILASRKVEGGDTKEKYVTNEKMRGGAGGGEKKNCFTFRSRCRVNSAKNVWSSKKEW